MIRKSAFVAGVAALLSLLLHVLGLGLFGADLPQQQAGEGAGEAVELGTTFEELADVAPEPVTPEEAETPEPPTEEAAEPDSAEIPTSQALVASPDPGRVTSPDVGVSEAVQPDASDEVIAESVAPPTPDTVTSAEPAATQPVEAEPVDDVAQAPVTSEPEQLAALPPVDTPTSDPVTPPEQAEVSPESTEVVEEPVQEEADIDAGASEQAVLASKRPRLPDRRPAAEPEPTLDGFRSFDNLRNPQQVVESPLTRYQKEGADPFRVSSGQSQQGGRGRGNSSTTNYAGEVLVHLNRAPVVFVTVRGFAQVFFEINPDGSLAWVNIVDSSGSRELERAAREQIRRAAPFPPPPGGKSRKLSFYYQNG
ncbi:TonB family C-terminal domain protein [Rhodobacteraceae bacterium KLH11]|nr:TonB family C-terminal domain protein [Rhodobacteraceae bacterium KLH11]